MIVKRESGFKPITITIETYEEARKLWVLLNLCPKAINTYTTFPIPTDTSLDISMFNKFNRVFDLRKGGESNE